MKILVAEDSNLLRSSLAQLLRIAGHEVTEVNDATALVESFTDHPVDLIVTDVRMPPTMTDDGLQAVHQLRADAERCIPVVVLSQYVAAAYLDSLLEHGSFGYLLKERVADVSDFTTTLETVAGGGTVVDPEVVTTLLRNRHTGISTLTERETEVLALMAQGLSNTQISARLFLSAGTVSKHVANIFLKLGFDAKDDNRRVRAVLEWLKHNPFSA